MMVRFFFLFFLFAAFADMMSAQDMPPQSDLSSDTAVLFRAGTDGYDNYRIPSIITTGDGTLLAFCEGRKARGDAGDIDLLCKRSVDGGKTWSKQVVVWDDGANTCGNPCPVLDVSTGTIWLMMTHNNGNDKEGDIVRGTSTGTRTVWVSRSTDDGLSWSSPRNITERVKPASWGWYATGPGVGIQILHGHYRGRLVIPADHSFRDSLGKYIYGANVFYSDDHGKAWKQGGNISPKVNECQVAELPDGRGTLMMNMRSNFGRHCRAISFSDDGGLTWTPPRDAPQLTEPVCQASMLRYTFPDGRDQPCLLFLNPDHPTKRMNMTLKASFDRGKTWRWEMTLFPGPSAYSSMAELKDGRLACFFEAGYKHPYESIRLRIITPEFIVKSEKKDKN